MDAQNSEGQTVLHIASLQGDDNIMRILFMSRANPSIVDHEDRAPIHLAAERGHTKAVEFLADKFKASVYERTRDGSTLMHIAAVNGHPETAMALFEKGVCSFMDYFQINVASTFCRCHFLCQTNLELGAFTLQRKRDMSM